jgi:predicted kinase
LSLKQIITEVAVVDSMFDIEQELMTIKESILEQVIVEGVDDPGILKCIFMAGGPGSGKSFTAMEIFGIDKRLKTSFSHTGLKTVNSDSAFEKGLKDNGIDGRKLAQIEKEDPDLWDKIANNDDSIRNKAKRITALQRKFYEAGRLGMIIDGTGHVYSKIQKNKKYAESLGYDTYMVFVNTSLEVAKERNQNRDRVLSDELLTKSWSDVQNNLGKFQNLFANNFRIVDNTVYKPIGKQVQKAVTTFVKAKIYNPIGKKWIKTARELKNLNLIKK